MNSTPMTQLIPRVLNAAAFVSLGFLAAGTFRGLLPAWMLGCALLLTSTDLLISILLRLLDSTAQLRNTNRDRL